MSQDKRVSSPEAHSDSANNAKILFIIGVCLNLLPWGLGMMGVTNLWLGSIIVFAAFCLLAYAFWIFEHMGKRIRLSWRVATITIAAFASIWLWSAWVGYYRRTQAAQQKIRTFLIPASDPTPTSQCGAIPSSLKVAIVGSMVTKFSSELKSFSLIRIANEDVLTVEYNAPDAIVINATIRDESNNIIATIKKKVFHSYVPHGYEATSPDPHTVLVLDANDQVILYVRYLNPQAIKVLGVFRQPPRFPVRVEEGRFFVGPREFALTVCAEGGGTDKDW